MCMPNLKYLGYIINSWVASQEAGGVADQAGRRHMDPNMYLFAPIVVETSGVLGKQTLPFLKDLACHVHKVSW